MRWLIGIVLLLSGCEGLDRIQNGRDYEIQEPDKSIGAVLLGSMIVTSYRSVREQTDDSPFIAADGHRVHPYGVAVSRDLHSRWGGQLKFGDIVYIEEIGFKVINDTMNKRHKQHLDVWVNKLEDEREFHKKFKGRKLNVWLVRRK